MRERSGSGRVAYFLAGCGIGAVVALLYAPGTGEETRKLIARKANEGRDYLNAVRRDLREEAWALVERAGELRKKMGERFAGAYQVGKQTYYAALGR